MNDTGNGGGALAPQKNSGHLPHIDELDHYQFVTFRTQDSVDSYVKKLQQRGASSRKQQLAMDQYLDQSKKGAYLNDSILILLCDFIKAKGAEFNYELVAFCVMPNHVHLLIKPLHKLARVMQRIKGSSAKLINEEIAGKGPFWAADYYDRVIRNERHFSVAYQYIKNNPIVLGEHEDSPSRFYGVYG